MRLAIGLVLVLLGLAAGGHAPAAAQTHAGCPLATPACEFAAQLHHWMRTADVEALLAHSRPVTATCPAQQVDGGDPFPLCIGARPGEERVGYVVGRLQSHTWTFSGPQYRELLRDWLARVDAGAQAAAGGDGLRLTTLGCPQGTPAGPTCGRQFAAVFTARFRASTPATVVREGPSPPSGREALIFLIEQSAAEAQPPLTALLAGTLAGRNEVLLTGGAESLLWFRDVVFGTSLTWKPAPPTTVSPAHAQDAAAITLTPDRGSLHASVTVRGANSLPHDEILIGRFGRDEAIWLQRAVADEHGTFLVVMPLFEPELLANELNEMEASSLLGYRQRIVARGLTRDADGRLRKAEALYTVSSVRKLPPVGVGLAADAHRSPVVALGILSIAIAGTAWLLRSRHRVR